MKTRKNTPKSKTKKTEAYNAAIAETDARRKGSPTLISVSRSEGTYTLRNISEGKGNGTAIVLATIFSAIRGKRSRVPADEISEVLSNLDRAKVEKAVEKFRGSPYSNLNGVKRLIGKSKSGIVLSFEATSEFLENELPKVKALPVAFGISK